MHPFVVKKIEVLYTKAIIVILTNFTNYSDMEYQTYLIN